jgi:hypothetical protein
MLSLMSNTFYFQQRRLFSSGYHNNIFRATSVNNNLDMNYLDKVINLNKGEGNMPD